jgi:hypothetical protein
VILKLFINKNTKFIHLSISRHFDYQLHFIPEVECCFSELKSFQCDEDNAHNILEKLARICKLIKKITILFNDKINTYKNYELIKLIEMQKNLNELHLFNVSSSINEPFYKSFEGHLLNM